MILDEQALFSNDQKITGTAYSTNILDMGAREISFGTPVPVFIQITEDFDKLTSLSVKVQTASDEAFSSPVDLIEQTIPAANLKKGETSTIKFLPKGNLGFMRLVYTVTGTSPSKGGILAGITDARQESYHNA